MNQVKSPKKDIDLKEYQDPIDLSPKNLEFGLWLANHQRQIYKIIIIILVAIAAGFLLYSGYGYFYYFVFGQEQDKILDQTTTGVDLANYRAQNKPIDLQTGTAQIIAGSVGSDFIVKIKNPNEKQYAAFSYCFTANTEKACGSDFILPNEEKNIILLNSQIKAASGTAGFDITGITWQKLKAGDIPDWNAFNKEHLNFTITDPKFNSYDDSVNYLEFSITNNSPYGYFTAPFDITVSQNDNIIAVNRYTIQNLSSQQTKVIRLYWPEAVNLKGDIKITPNINILDSEIYKPYNSSDSSNSNSVSTSTSSDND